VKIETFRRGVDAFNRGDLGTWIATMHPNVTFEPMRSRLEGAYRGHAGVRRFFLDNAESFESYALKYSDVRDLGEDRLLAIGTFHLRATMGGLETEVPTAAVATFLDGLLVHWKGYGDPKKALEAAGLSE
jgi:ketosteroid isomerase-like protein